MKIISLTTSNPYLVSTVAYDTAQVLKDGGLIIYPSDTVYGVLVDAASEKAVDKLISFKNRPIGKPTSVFVPDMHSLESTVVVNGDQKRVIDELLPGPFTLVLPSRHTVSKRLESEKGTLGVRMPDYFPVHELGMRLNRPFTATSANVSGRSPHYSVDSLLNTLPQAKKDLIDLIVDVGSLPRNKPSTIVDLSTKELKLLRKGDLVFTNNHTFMSNSPAQTKKIAHHALTKVVKATYHEPLIFIIKGELGAGKTVFVQGIGEVYGIKDIVSPTYVIYYEYLLDHNRLYHLDLYNIEDVEELEGLQIEKMLQGRNILCIEWGDKTAELIPLFKKYRAVMVEVSIAYKDQDTRSIQIQYNI